MLPRNPVKKLSTQSTSWPSARRRPQRCEPRNPAPPVTSERLRDENLILMLQLERNDRTKIQATAIRVTRRHPGMPHGAALISGNRQRRVRPKNSGCSHEIGVEHDAHLAT